MVYCYSECLCVFFVAKTIWRGDTGMCFLPCSDPRFAGLLVQYLSDVTNRLIPTNQFAVYIKSNPSTGEVPHVPQRSQTNVAVVPEISRAFLFVDAFDSFRLHCISRFIEYKLCVMKQKEKPLHQATNVLHQSTENIAKVFLVIDCRLLEELKKKTLHLPHWVPKIVLLHVN